MTYVRMGLSCLLLCTGMMIYILLSIAFLSSTISSQSKMSVSSTWHREDKLLNDDGIQRISQVIDRQHDTFNETLDAFLIERVSGTIGNRQVREYIKNSMAALGWYVEEDAFMAETPHGTKPFSNIITTLDPRACRRLVLACHYDSKFFANGVFLGATDSAVPCAMLIHLARSLQHSLQRHKEKGNDITLQFIFFDGEEAFEQWSSTDSIYGARHLADRWHKTPYRGTNCDANNNIVSELDRMEVLVLLDLLGGPSPKFKSYFPDTLSLYERLVSIEKNLKKQELLESHPSDTKYFSSRSSFSMIEDDHIPFMKKGVPILHIIPTPFPSVWHRFSDNRENLHHPTINNLNKIFHIFVAEYLHLDVNPEEVGQTGPEKI